MARAEDILKQQKIEQPAKIVPKDAISSAQDNLVEQELILKTRETELKIQALSDGFDSVDPIGAFHKAVDTFNQEKEQFSAERIRHNVNVQLFIEDRKKLVAEISANQDRFKILNDDINAKENLLTEKRAELLDIQKAIQTLGNECSTKKGELEDINERITLALKKCRKLVLAAEDRQDYYYSIAMSDQWGKFVYWVKNLFSGLRF
jgi:chromosome segregation ATPase